MAGKPDCWAVRRGCNCVLVLRFLGACGRTGAGGWPDRTAVRSGNFHFLFPRDTKLEGAGGDGAAGDFDRHGVVGIGLRLFVWPMRPGRHCL